MTTFAVVSGVAGAGLPTSVIVVLRNGQPSRRWLQHGGQQLPGDPRRATDARACTPDGGTPARPSPEGEREEIRQIFARKGVAGDDLEQLVRILTSDRRLWVDTMLEQELGLSLVGPSAGRPEPPRSARSSSSGWCRCSIFLYELLAGPAAYPYFWSTLLTGGAFFAVGAAKGRFVEPALVSVRPGDARVRRHGGDAGLLRGIPAAARGGNRGLTGQARRSTRRRRMSATIATSIEDIPELLGWLPVTAPVTWRVHTAYLDTSAERAEKPAHLLAFRDLCKAIRPSLQANEVSRFERAIRQAEDYLVNGVQAGHPGLALFASGGDDYFFAMPLPRRPTDEIAWAERPLLGQLESVLDDCPRIAVALCDEERAQIFTIRLGTIEEKRSLHDEDEGQKATRAGWHSLRRATFVTLRATSCATSFTSRASFRSRSRPGRSITS